MKSSVITFPGSNCDRDMDVALKKFGFKNKMVWHDDAELPKSDLVVLPGGFSYGDYLRCGSMASKSKIMKSVMNFANSGGMVMGICNGFQILVETGLVPGVLLRNKYLEFICKNVFVKIKNKKNTYFKNIDNDVLEFHIAHNEGNYFCTKDQLKEIEDNEQVAINYCNKDGKTEEQFNPNGSIKCATAVDNFTKKISSIFDINFFGLIIKQPVSLSLIILLSNFDNLLLLKSSRLFAIVNLVNGLYSSAVISNLLNGKISLFNISSVILIFIILLDFSFKLISNPSIFSIISSYLIRTV